MDFKETELLQAVEKYYSDKLLQYGNTPRGVDWNSEAGQELRFQQLCRILPDSGHYSLNDLGCGYGALLDYLHLRNRPGSYVGVDVSNIMIHAAQARHASVTHARFIRAQVPDQIANYCIASGIFNVRLNTSDLEWFDYLQQTIDVLHSSSNVGFAFNCLSSYSDEEKKRDDLYYADPCKVFDLCQRRYTRHVALLHDYGLYEFTILVRKMP